MFFWVRSLIGMPGGSKTWICTTSGSQLEMPPWALPPLISKRLTAAELTRRSRTSTPVEFRPLIMARLMTRDAGWASRLVTTLAPLGSVVP